MYIESQKYYWSLVIDLMVTSPGFREECRNSCPTYHLDWTECTEEEDARNKASTEIDFLYEIGLLFD